MIDSITSWLSSFFVQLFSYMIMPFQWLCDAFVYVIGFSVAYALQGFYVCVEGIIMGIDFTSYLTSFMGQAAGLPPQLLYLMAQCGFSECLDIALAAFTIRLILNCIPAAVTRI